MGADAAGLARLRDGEALGGHTVTAQSEDEEHELDALLEAADAGPVVVVAEVASADAPVTLDWVAALHVDPDGSGDLAWYASQELDDVLALLA